MNRKEIKNMKEEIQGTELEKVTGGRVQIDATSMTVKFTIANKAF